MANFIIWSALICLAQHTPSSAAAPQPGDYAGWAYMDGNDFPLRLHLRTNAAGLAATVDVPAEGAFDLPFEQVRFHGGHIELSRRNRKGVRWDYVGEHRDGLIEGTISVGGEHAGKFQLHRSVLPLPHIDHAGHDTLCGMYRLSDGRLITISAWPWGELRCSDSLTGRWATLFATSPTEFFMGSGMYVPSSVSARLKFEPSDAARGPELIYTLTGGPTVRGRRETHSETAIEFASQVKLSGTLLLPPGPGPHPAVVVIGGSGWSLRDQLRNDADRFLGMGVAAFIHDRRGYGASAGDPVCSFADLAKDITAAVRMLKQRKEIAPDRIGVAGRSRGGWIAPLAASMCDDIAFTVLFVAPAVSPAQQETTRRLNLMRSRGHSPDELRVAEAYLGLTMRCFLSDDDWNKYAASREQINKKGWLDMLGGPEAKDSDAARWERMNMLYDPIPALSRVKCPTLAIFGEADDNVTPAQNAEPMRAALHRAGCRDAQIVIVPNADHGLSRVDPTISPDFRLHRGIGGAPELWPAVKRFVDKHALKRPTDAPVGRSGA